MSYVGEPFKHDVFVSYARAEVETDAPDMRLWCGNFAKRLRTRLSTALNTDPAASPLKLFFDDRVLQAGEPLTEILRDTVQRSALLLVLMSPLYPHKSWCCDELEWFFEQADKDGRGHRHCSVLRIQPLPDAAWPKRLRDERDRPVLYRDLVDRDAGLPIGFDDYESPALKEAIRQTQIELKGKLEELRAQFEARRVYEQAAAPPTRPVIYLQARREDLPAWQTTRGELEPHAIVNPDALPEPVSDDALLQQQRDRRLKEYTYCDGLILLRAGTDEEFRVEVAAAYKDRQHLFQSRRRNIPWAIVDRRGDAPRLYSAYRVPCVPATHPEWPMRLVQIIRQGTGLSS